MKDLYSLILISENSSGIFCIAFNFFFTRFFYQWLKSVVDLQCAIAGSLEKSHRKQVLSSSPSSTNQTKITPHSTLTTTTSHTKSLIKKIATGNNINDGTASAVSSSSTVKKEGGLKEEERKMEVDDVDNMKVKDESGTHVKLTTTNSSSDKLSQMQSLVAGGGASCSEVKKETSSLSSLAAAGTGEVINLWKQLLPAWEPIYY